MADDFLSVMKVLPDPVGGFMQGQQDAATLAQTQAQTQQANTGSQYNQYRLQQAQQADQLAQQQQQSWTQDIASLMKNPTSEGVSNLILKYPDQIKPITDSWAMRGKDKQAADITQSAQVWSALNSGNADMAQKILEERDAADKAAGSPGEPLVAHVLQMIKAGDIEGAKGAMTVALATSPAGKDFADNLKNIHEARGGTHVLGYGNSLVNEGKVAYQAPTKPEQPQYKVITDPATGQPHIYEIGSDGEAGSNTPGVAGKIIAVEGPGSNPKSSAKGPGQFIDSTFVKQYRASFPDQAGLTDAQILTKRGTGVEPKMVQDATSANASALQSAGIPVTDGNLYAAHFLGLSGASAVLRADPSTPVRSILPAGVIAANPQLKNMTVGGFKDWADQKMASAPQGGGKVRDITPANLGGGDPSSDGMVGGLTPDAIDAAADLGLQKYNGSPPPGYSRNKQAQAAIANRIAEKVDGYGGIEGAIAHAQLVHAQGKALDSFIGGKNGDIVRTASVALDHLGTLGAAADALGNGNVTAFNKVANYFSKQTGGAAPTDFNAVRGIVSQEVAKFIGAGHITDKSVLDVQAGIENSSSPAQLRGYIKKMQALMAGQLGGLKRQYESTAGPRAPAFTTFLSPAAQAMINTPHPTQAAPKTPPPQTAITALRKNPNLRAQFDAKYGAGASTQVLGH